MCQEIDYYFHTLCAFELCCGYISMAYKKSVKFHSSSENFELKRSLNLYRPISMYDLLKLNNGTKQKPISCVSMKISLDQTAVTVACTVLRS